MQSVESNVTSAPSHENFLIQQTRHVWVTEQKSSFRFRLNSSSPIAPEVHRHWPSLSSYRKNHLLFLCVKVRSRVPVTAEVAPAAPPPLPDLSLPSTELNGHCQESCATEECKLTLYSPDEDLVSCDVDISLPITPLKVCVAFADSPHQTGYRSSSFHRSPSEPQEDEWCDT